MKNLFVTLVIVLFGSIVSINAQIWSGPTNNIISTTNSVNIGDGTASSLFQVTINGGTNSGKGSAIAFQAGGAYQGWIGSSSYMESNTSSNLGIQSYTGKSINFYTNNSLTANMVINTLGYVGIGTTNPLSNLQIGTLTPIASTSPVALSMGASYSSIPGTNAKFKLWDNGTSSSVYGFGVSSGSLDAIVPTGALFNWYINGINKMTLNGVGNLGIGTNSPNGGLDILTSSQDHIRFSTIGGIEMGGIDCYSASSPNQRIEIRGRQGLAFLTGLASKPFEAMRITTSGNVGIGTPTPGYPLEVNGSNNYIISAKVIATTGKYIANFINNNNEGLFICHNGSDNAFYGAGANTIVLAADFTSGGNYQNLAFSTNNKTVMTLATSGNIGIGTIHPAYTLDVLGTIRAQDVKVDMNGVADYVFKPGYNLRSISEVDKYIKENNHLPDIKSAEEIEKDGASVSEMQNKLLQKVEELTLYVIEQNKKNEALQQKVEQLEKELESKK